MEHISKIHINCGSCNSLKGCAVRKIFTETARQFSDSNQSEKYQREFDLKCPFKTDKYKEGDIVRFTVCHGVHEAEFKWHCENECFEECQRDCEDGVITFVNKRYSGNIQLTGEIISKIPKGYIIKISQSEYDKLKPLLNEKDIITLMAISNAIQCPFNWENSDYISYFVSKQKYITNGRE